MVSLPMRFTVFPTFYPKGRRVADFLWSAGIFIPCFNRLFNTLTQGNKIYIIFASTLERAICMRIITDSAADFTREDLAAYDIHCVSTQVIFGDESFASIDMDEAFFWERMIAGENPKTSQPSPEAFLAEFEAARDADEDALCVCVSSAVSGTIQSANIAAGMLDYNRIHIFDSLNGAAGQKLLLLYACKLRDEGRNLAQEIIKKLESLRERIRLFACLDTLEYLARSGRMPKALASLGTLARLKPIVTAATDGHIGLCGQAFGRHRAIDNLVERISSFRIDPSHPIIPIYSHSKENCRAMLKKLATRGIEVSEERLCAIGPSIAPHIGPDAYGVAFVEAE